MTHNLVTNRVAGVFTAVALVLAIAAMGTETLPAQTFNVIYTFTGGADGNAPFGTPMLYNGNIYGTTKAGGASNNGTIYEVNFASRHEAVLHAFTGSDGTNPLAGLIQDLSGNLYGTTYTGGAHGRGTVFKLTLTPTVTYTVLHSFAGRPDDGAQPAGPLAFDTDFNLYGTTYDGGSTLGYGTTFEIAVDGTLTIGQSFPPGGALPHGGLCGLGGTFYGTTSGAPPRFAGGTIFQSLKAAPLYTFTGGADGAQPMAGLIGDSLGNLYGTTAAGGNGSFGLGNGVVFAYNVTSHKLTVLHTFTGPDGSAPMAALARDAAGNLYGTTFYGGASNNGTVFKLDHSGNLTTLHSFTGGADGARPAAGVLVDAKGNIWGVATGGGASGAGTLFIIATAPTL